MKKVNNGISWINYDIESDIFALYRYRWSIKRLFKHLKSLYGKIPEIACSGRDCSLFDSQKWINPK